FILNITALFIEKILSVVFFRNAGGTPPVIEEFLFRKILPLGLEKLLERINRTTAIIIANGIFAAVHFDWFFFPYFVNGCLYAWSYEKTKDLKVPMLAHISYNSFVFLATSFLVN
ncbi:CPBP family intramembrane metalloprotease, partial [Bacillus cereus]|nr:CPBP family intramembrane metalloprotease [Bacillus cereus]